MKLLILAILSIVFNATESYCMKTNKINEHYVEKFSKITRDYVNNTRLWNEDEYVIKFYYIDTEKNIALLSATHKSVFDILSEKIKKDGCIKVLERFPSLEIDIVIDLIDFVVISENELGTKYPNAGKKLPYNIMQ